LAAGFVGRTWRRRSAQDRFWRWCRRGSFGRALVGRLSWLAEGGPRGLDWCRRVELRVCTGVGRLERRRLGESRFAHDEFGNELELGRPSRGCIDKTPCFANAMFRKCHVLIMINFSCGLELDLQPSPISLLFLYDSISIYSICVSPVTRIHRSQS
jgi:hypothetical protein